MPNKCSVPGCKTGYYPDTEKIGLFRFPKDPTRNELWLSLFPKKNFTQTKYSRVCAKHFLDKFLRGEIPLRQKGGTVMKKKRFRLTTDAYPSIFPDLNSDENNQTELEHFDIQSRIESWVSRNKISDFLSFCQEAKYYFGEDRWVIKLSRKVKDDDDIECIQFYFMQEMSKSWNPSPLFTVTVSTDMHVTVHSDIPGDQPEVALHMIFGKRSPPIIAFWSQFVNMMSLLSCSTGFWINNDNNDFDDPSVCTNDKNELPALKRSDQTLHSTSGEDPLFDAADAGVAAKEDVEERVRLRDENVDLAHKLHKVIFQRNQLVKMLEHIYGLASINLDILSTVQILDEDPAGREEMDKIYKLVDTIMNDFQEITSDPMHIPVLPLVTEEKSKLIPDDDYFLNGKFPTLGAKLPPPDKGLKADDAGEINRGSNQNDVDSDCTIDDPPLFEKSPPLEDQKNENEKRTDDDAKERESLTVVKKNKRLKDVPCEICGKKFVSNVSIAIHKHYSHKEMSISHECLICGKKNKSVSILKEHMKRHSEEKTYLCSICGSTFKFRKSLYHHMFLHSGEKKFECRFCHKRFRRKDNAKAHEKKLHINVNYVKERKRNILYYYERGADNLYHCKICGKGFAIRSRLHWHMGHHTDETPFKCTLCDKAYRFRQSLNAHVKKHKDKRPFECDLCPNTFKSKAQLQSHQKVHTDVRQFKCDVCGRQFKWPKSLQKHLCRVVNEVSAENN